MHAIIIEVDNKLLLGHSKLQSQGVAYSNTTRSTEVKWVKIIQNEVMVENCSKSLVRAIGNVLRVICT